MNIESKNIIREMLVEDAENFADVVEFVGKNGINLLNYDGDLVSGYDLIVKYYSGVVIGLDLFLKQYDVEIPNELLQKQMQVKLKEITDEISTK